MNKDQCKQDESNTTRKTNRSKENEWALIYSNQVIKNSQIINVWIDEEDNDSKSLVKGHSFLTHKIHNEIDTRKCRCLKAPIRTLISNCLNEVSSMKDDIVYIHTCAYFYLFIYFAFFFTCTYSKYQQMNSTENT